MSAVCGASWFTLHTLPGYSDSGNYPGRRRPCTGLVRCNGEPYPSWRWASGVAYPRGWRSPFLSLRKIHVGHHGTGWKTISGNWWCRISPSTGPPPGQSLWSRCPPPLGDHHHQMTGSQRRKFSSPGGCLNDGDNLIPVSGSGFSSQVAAQIHILRCSSPIPDGPPARYSFSRSTASKISSYPRIL